MYYLITIERQSFCVLTLHYNYTISSNNHSSNLYRSENEFYKTILVITNKGVLCILFNEQKYTFLRIHFILDH